MLLRRGRMSRANVSKRSRHVGASCSLFLNKFSSQPDAQTPGERASARDAEPCHKQHSVQWY